MQLLFADQLGSHFDLGGEILLPVVTGQFAKRSYHRQKAHLILYSLLARGADERVELLELENYRDLADTAHHFVAIRPSSRPMLSLAEALKIELLDHRGFCSSRSEFAEFARDKGKLKLEDFYRIQRRRLEILMDGAEPVEGRWNFDKENRLPAPKQGLGLPHPWQPKEDELDREVRARLDQLEAVGVKFRGSDGPRKFAATQAEAEFAILDFLDNRLPLFGPYEDAVDERDWVMAHSMLSVPLNLGLIDPLDLVKRVEARYRDGSSPIASVEGFIRQVIGWRDYVWHLYWHFPEDYVQRNSLGANRPLPLAISELRSGEIRANCVSKTIASIDQSAWTHHIPRLMILGNAFLQRGYRPQEVNDWFIDAFADGTPWVMPANVIGMSLYADGGMMSTKPYAAGGAYINRMTNHCKGCQFDPKVRLGENACPITAGYWDFIGTHLDEFSKNHRMFQPVSGYKRLGDLSALHAQEAQRESL
jgi:deoxyribodipyrimidine photolyase-related protein